MNDFEALANRLESVAADIDEMAFDRLREAVSDGEIERPKHDKQLMQARRAIEKAMHLLRSMD